MDIYITHMSMTCTEWNVGFTVVSCCFSIAILMEIYLRSLAVRGKKLAKKSSREHEELLWLIRSYFSLLTFSPRPTNCPWVFEDGLKYYFKSALCCKCSAQFWHYLSQDYRYSLNCTPLNSVTITNYKNSQNSSNKTYQLKILQCCSQI